MAKLKILIRSTLISICAFSSLRTFTCLAETPQDRSKSDRLRGLYKLEVDMTETTFLGSEDDLVLRATLIASYEKLVEVSCFKNETSSSASSSIDNKQPNLDDETCSTPLNRLLELDAYNPTGICARDGIKTPLCKNLIAAVDLKSLESFPTQRTGDSEFLPLQQNIAKNQGEIRSLQTDLSSAQIALRRRGSPEDKERALDLIGKLIPLTCRVSRLMLEPLENDDFFLAMSEVRDKKPVGKDPLVSELNSLLNPTVTPSSITRSKATVSAKDYDIFAMRENANKRAKASSTARAGSKNAKNLFKHTKVVVESCINYINRALNIDPNFYQAICSRDGNFAESCKKAVAMARQKKARLKKNDVNSSSATSSASNSSSDSKGFSTF